MVYFKVSIEAFCGFGIGWINKVRNVFSLFIFFNYFEPIAFNKKDLLFNGLYCQNPVSQCFRIPPGEQTFSIFSVFQQSRPFRQNSAMKNPVF